MKHAEQSEERLIPFWTNHNSFTRRGAWDFRNTVSHFSVPQMLAYESPAISSLCNSFAHGSVIFVAYILKPLRRG